MDKLISLFQDLIDRYNISDEDVSRINSVVYGDDDEPGLFGDQFAEEAQMSEVREDEDIDEDVEDED